jgi:hypothetical protein
MSDDPAEQIARQIALAGLALSQVAFLVDLHRPLEMSDIRYVLAQRKLLSLLSDAAHLAMLFEIRAERAGHGSSGTGMRVVRGSEVPITASDDTGELISEWKTHPDEVDRDDLTWERPRLAGAHGLEVAALPGGSVAVRDADDPTGPLLVASRWEWETFAASIATGGFTLLR